jgi:hypothetical protein
MGFCGSLRIFHYRNGVFCYDLIWIPRKLLCRVFTILFCVWMRNRFTAAFPLDYGMGYACQDMRHNASVVLYSTIRQSGLCPDA